MGSVLSKELTINSTLIKDTKNPFNNCENIAKNNEPDNEQIISEINNSNSPIKDIKKDNKNKNDELDDDSSATNSSSSKLSFENINKSFAEETCNNIDENISENSNEEEEDSTEKNQGNKELTKKIKIVFKDSRLPEVEKNTSNSERSTLSLTNNNNCNSFSSLSETIDYEFNIIRSGKEIRESYLAKLITKNIWKPNFKEKMHNSIIIFDWDDTLLPTSFLSPGGNFNFDIILSKSDKEKLLKIEKEVYTLLGNATSKGDVYIITNAESGWVEFSANTFYPSLKDILAKIKIISAREEFGKIFPEEIKEWKIQSFLNLLKFTKVKLVTNLICLGDSFYEIEAGRILASQFREAFIKTIKFKEKPKLDDLLKQLTAVNQSFNSIYSTIRNMKIKVERKKA